MHLSELKKALAKFGSDFDDCEVLLSYKDVFGHEDCDLVVGTGHDPEMKYIYLFGLQTVERLLENPVNKKFKKGEQ